MQLHVRLWQCGAQLSFSTLYGSKWVATFSNSNRSIVLSSFSTLYGSKWVATDHRSANPIKIRVSVPSTGRSGLQLPKASRGAEAQLRFSTLYGSKWVATKSDRGELRAVASFSTLYGSKWVATHPRFRLKLPLGGFSTLYGSKWVATVGTSRHFINDSRVSVPSTGRSGLQHYGRRWNCPSRLVSVPSTGRSGLQLDVVRSERFRALGFSTLYGSKWVATWFLARRVETALMFQYPLRVEVGCNVNCPR